MTPLTTIKLKTTLGDWQEFEVPISKDDLEVMRKRWKEWKKKNHDHLEVGWEQSTARRVTGIDDMKLSDFDAIIMGFAVVAPRIKYEGERSDV